MKKRLGEKNQNKNTWRRKCYVVFEGLEMGLMILYLVYRKLFKLFSLAKMTFFCSAWTLRVVCVWSFAFSYVDSVLLHHWLARNGCTVCYYKKAGTRTANVAIKQHFVCYSKTKSVCIFSETIFPFVYSSKMFASVYWFRPHPCYRVFLGWRFLSWSCMSMCSM